MIQEPTKLRKASNAYSIFILVLTILSLAAMVVMLLPLPESTLSLLRFYDTMICVIFLIDFFVILHWADKKSDYLIGQRGWLDLLGSMPAFGIFRFGGLLRLARLSRLMRIADGWAVEQRRALVRDVLNNRSEYAVFVTLFLTILVLTVASVLVLQFESTSPEANITTGGPWHSIVTITTVGYGDYYPVSFWGGVTAMFIMFAGVGIIGALASILASFLVGSSSSAKDEGAPPAAPALSVQEEAKGRQGRAGPHASDAGEIGAPGRRLSLWRLLWPRTGRKTERTRRSSRTAEIEVAAQAAEASEPAPKLRRKEFEKELEPLQVERQDAGMGEGQRRQDLRALRGARAQPARGASSSVSPNGPARASSGWWRWRRRPNGKRPRCTSSATCPICRQPAKWFSSIAVGTTGRVSNG